MQVMLSVENFLIGLCFFVVAGLIGNGLWKQQNKRANVLGWATFAIFFTCAAGHMMHAITHFLVVTPETALASSGAVVPATYANYICSALGITNPMFAGWIEGGQTLADGLTVIAAVMFLSLRQRYGLLANNENLVFDYQQKVAQFQEKEAEMRTRSADLELLVSERTNALQAALEEAQQRAIEQTRLLQEVEQQQEIIRELSVPILPVASGTLVMPLVGALDSNRLRIVQERALQAIESSAAHYLLLDITGVPVVDTQVANGLIGVVQATRLMGAETILVGIRPEVTQTIVALGLDLRMIRTRSDLKTALTDLTAPASSA
jgi:anti-anti-sigma regulatory factor